MYLHKKGKNGFTLMLFFLLHTMKKCRLPLYIRTFETYSLKNIETFIGKAHKKIYEYSKTPYLTLKLLQLIVSENLSFIHKTEVIVEQCSCFHL